MCLQLMQYSYYCTCVIGDHYLRLPIITVFFVADNGLLYAYVFIGKVYIQGIRVNRNGVHLSDHTGIV